MIAKRSYYLGKKKVSDYYASADNMALFFSHLEPTKAHDFNSIYFYQYFQNAIQSVQDLNLIKNDLSVIKNSFMKNQHCLIPNFLNKETLDYLNVYYDYLSLKGFLRRSDQHVENRIWAHNDFVTRKIQFQTEEIIEKIIGKKIKKGFTSFLQYDDCAELTKHLDRDQATYTLSIQLQYLNETTPVENQWPIFIDDKNGQTISYQAKNGQAVLFKGNELIHYREKLKKGHNCRVICLHFTTSDYQGKFL